MCGHGSGSSSPILWFWPVVPCLCPCFLLLLFKNWGWEEEDVEGRRNAWVLTLSLAIFPTLSPHYGDDLHSKRLLLKPCWLYILTLRRQFTPSCDETDVEKRIKFTALLLHTLLLLFSTINTFISSTVHDYYSQYRISVFNLTFYTKGFYCTEVQFTD